MPLVITCLLEKNNVSNYRIAKSHQQNSVCKLCSVVERLSIVFYFCLHVKCHSTNCLWQWCKVQGLRYISKTVITFNKRLRSTKTYYNLTVEISLLSYSTYKPLFTHHYRAAASNNPEHKTYTLSGSIAFCFLPEKIYIGSYMSAHVLLNLKNDLGKRDKMRGLPSILSLFRNEFNKFNNTGI